MYSTNKKWSGNPRLTVFIADHGASGNHWIFVQTPGRSAQTTLAARLASA
jgi:hypothetical protein